MGSLILLVPALFLPAPGLESEGAVELVYTEGAGWEECPCGADVTAEELAAAYREVYFVGRLLPPCCTAKVKFPPPERVPPTFWESFALGRPWLWEATAPFRLPALLVGDDLFTRGLFPLSPYPGGHNGYMVFPCDGDCLDDRGELPLSHWFLHNSAGRYSGDQVFDLRGRARQNFSVRFDRSSGWGHRIHFLLSIDPDYPGVPFGTLDYWGFDLTARIAQTEWVLIHTGLGFAALVGDEDDTGESDGDGGLNTFASVDLFPGNPVVLSGEAEMTMLESGNTLWHGRGTVGLNWKGLEVFTGWDYLWLNDVARHGPLAGVRLWW